MLPAPFEAGKLSMTTDYNYTYSNITFTHFSGFSSTDIQKYSKIFGEEAVFTQVKARDKAGFTGWTNPDKLITAKKAQFLVDRNRNVGVALGVETDRGYTVCFDKESYGEVPEEVIDTIRQYSVIEFDSQSGGNNHLLTVSREAIEQLNQYKTKVWFSDGEKHDLEILTSGHALVPPSRIDESHQYDNLKIDPQAPTVGIESIKEILSNIPISKKDEGDKSQTTNKQDEGSNSNVEYQELPSDFNPNAYFDNNIPGTDSFLERIDTMLEDERVSELIHAENSDRSEAELELQRRISFYFNADKKMIQYIFENLLPVWSDKTIKYEVNKYHRKDVLDNVGEYTPRPYYLTGVSFNLREQLSRAILRRDTVTVQELHGNLLRTDNLENYTKRNLQYAIKYFKQLDLIEEVSPNTYRNKRIDTEYVQKLQSLNKEYEPMGELV